MSTNISSQVLTHGHEKDVSPDGDNWLRFRGDDGKRTKDTVRITVKGKGLMADVWIMVHGKGSKDCNTIFRILDSPVVLRPCDAFKRGRNLL